jgi:L-ascorbate metabolism protein UlaG (beta-lactamase superfamily)
MDIEYKGGNCVTLTVKKNVLAFDPKNSDLGLKDQAANAAVQLVTQPQFIAPHSDDTVVIDGPGEYEVANMSIRGVAARAHMDSSDAPKKATMYSVSTEDISVAAVGHVHPGLSEEQLEQLGVVDILIVPVGGNGYTLDATGAVDLVRKISPKAVIPTHYADSNVAYPVPQADIELFIKELGAPVEEVSKLKLKAGAPSEALTVYKITRTS